MARMLRRRRPLWKKRVAKRKPAMKRYKKSPSQGRLFVVRKVQELHSSNSNLGAGSYIVQEGNNSITFGAPVATPAITGCYDVPFSIQFRLDELTSYVDLSSLFDRYRITSCKVKVQSTFFSSGQTTTPAPYIDYITDHDDATPPSVLTMREKMGVKTKYFSGTRPSITMGVKPVPAQLIYNSGAFNAYGVPRKSPFINMTNTGVPHYAIKGVIRNLYLPAATNSSPLTWDISYGVVCKDVQ